MFRADVGECYYRAIRRELGVVEHEFVWTASAGGAVELAVPDITGVVWKLQTRPQASPTDNYDITLLNDRGLDVLLGKGADRDTATVEGVFVYDAYNNMASLYTTGLHRFVVANAGNATSGVTIVTTVPLGAAVMPRV